MLRYREQNYANTDPLSILEEQYEANTWFTTDFSNIIGHQNSGGCGGTLFSELTCRSSPWSLLKPVQDPGECWNSLRVFFLQHLPEALREGLRTQSSDLYLRERGKATNLRHGRTILPVCCPGEEATQWHILLKPCSLLFIYTALYFTPSSHSVLRRKTNKDGVCPTVEELIHIHTGLQIENYSPHTKPWPK